MSLYHRFLLDEGLISVSLLGHLSCFWRTSRLFDKVKQPF